jgi:hypothetical protein
MSDTPSIVPTMSNSEQTVPVDLMIRRLEEANARAHQRVRSGDDRVSEPQQDAAPPDQKSPAVPASRSWLALGLGLLLAAFIGVVAFVWQSSYFDAAKPIVAHQTSPQTVAPTAAPISPELAQRLQTMANDIANVAQGIEQLKKSQEQMVRDNEAVGEQLKAALSQLNRDNAAVGALRPALSQITRDNAAVAGQLKAALSQMARDNAKIAEQLKASQEKVDAKVNLRPGSAPLPQPIPTRTQEQAAILGVLTDNKGPMTPTELATATGQPNRNIRQLLYKMAKSGEIFQYGRGRYGIQPNAGNNDNANNNRPLPALPSPQAPPEPQDQQQFQ